MSTETEVSDAAPSTGPDLASLMGSVAPGRFAPALLVASEMTWISLCLSALVNTSPKFAMDIPYLDLAIPAAVAALIAATIIRLPIRLRWRLVLAGFVALVVSAAGAGLLGSRSLPGAFGALALHPWTLTGRVPSATCALAWFAVCLGVARANWLGLLPGSFRQIGRSAAVTGLFFLILLIVLATSHDKRLELATRGAPVLLVVFFVEVLALARLMRVREEEAEGLAGESASLRRVWTVLLAVPLLVVLGAALVLSLAARTFGHGIGVGARATGKGIATGATAVARGFAYLLVHVAEGIVAAIGAVVGLFYHHHIANGPTRKAVTTTTVAHLGLAPKPPVALAVVLGVALFGGVFLLFWRHRPPRRRPERVKNPPQQLDSVFTWGHLLRLLFAWLGNILTKLLSRLFSRRARAGPPRRAPTGVRGEYLRVLEAAAAAGRGRLRTETAREFARRLGDELVGSSEDLHLLTAAYERVRYADGLEGDAPIDPERAGELATVIVESLANLDGEQGAREAA